uniref:BZIP protein 5 n=1 Tax=Lonicera japonica TaxID=105884 RepID=A0A4Y1JT18_LONJA|nr:bZIP protein 5 [Lonicera japonica]
MENSEEAKSVKPEKPSSPAPDQANYHVYPDWAAMQAYYGQRMPVPPYFNSAVASGHHPPHPYMWGPPQPMMPPYGAPYAVYAHGGVYAHPGVPLPATPLSMDAPAKSSGNTDRGLMKKLKGFDGLAMSIGNDNADSAEGGTDHGLSQSGTGETEGSSDGSDGNTAGTRQNGGKRSREGTPNIVTRDDKNERENGPVTATEVKGASEIVVGVTVAPKIMGNMVGTVVSPGMNMALELSNPSPAVKTSPTSSQPSCTVIPNETWTQNERELKRERRKQSNRESARRSRLRKQAEAEELAIKVESLTAENMTLKSEINLLTEKSEKLKLENAKLMEKMKGAQLGQTEELAALSKVDGKKVVPLSTANLLSRVNNSGPAEGEGSEIYEKNSGAKLRQLLNASPRTDAVAAG